MTIYTVAYQGEPGAYSEHAALDFFGARGQPVPSASFDLVFERVASGECDFGVVPVENSLAGSVHRNYDLLVRHQLRIVGEVVVRVSHNLIALPGVELSDIRRVQSHWQALGQVERTLSQLLPDAQRVEVYDTAGAVKLLAEEQRRDTAAVASRRAAGLYGLSILRAGIEDDPTNFTRMIVLARDAVAAGEFARPGGGYKTSIEFAVRNTPGSLFRAMAAFALRDIDLTKIESRPLPGAPWDYRFYLDFAGHQSDPPCARALAQLAEIATELRVLGSYPRAATTG